MDPRADRQIDEDLRKGAVESAPEGWGEPHADEPEWHTAPLLSPKTSPAPIPATSSRPKRSSAQTRTGRRADLLSSLTLRFRATEPEIRGVACHALCEPRVVCCGYRSSFCTSWIRHLVYPADRSRLPRTSYVLRRLRFQAFSDSGTRSHHVARARAIRASRRGASVTETQA